MQAQNSFIYLHLICLINFFCCSFDRHSSVIHHAHHANAIAKYKLMMFSSWPIDILDCLQTKPCLILCGRQIIMQGVQAQVDSTSTKFFDDMSSHHHDFYKLTYLVCFISNQPDILVEEKKREKISISVFCFVLKA